MLTWNVQEDKPLSEVYRLATFTLPDGRTIRCLDILTARYCAEEIFGKEDYLGSGVIRLAPGDTVVDVGANIGLLSLWAAGRIPGGRLLALEPVPVIHEVLAENLRKHLPEDVEAETRPVGLSDRTGTARIRYFPRVSADSALARPDRRRKVRAITANWERRMGDTFPALRRLPRFLRPAFTHLMLAWLYRGRTVDCRLTTLGTLADEAGLDRIDLLKIDAENHDREVLAGIPGTLWPRIRQVAMEVHEHIPGGEGLAGEISRDLTGRGFAVTVGEEYEPGMGVRMLYAVRTGDEGNTNHGRR